MTEQQQKTPEDKHEANNLAKKRKKWIAIAVSIFVLAGLAFLIYWLIWGQFSETTDDAYVNGNQVTVMPQIQGIVTSILTDNTQLVNEGQPLITLDPHDSEIAFERAKSTLGQTVRDVVQLFANVYQLEAQREVRNADLIRATLDYEHRKNLVDTGSVPREEFEHSETTLYAAYASLQQVEEDLLAAEAEVAGTTIRTHPRVEVAKARVKETFLSLQRCVIYAPATGIATQRSAQVGQSVMPGTPLLAIVPIDQMWIDANYREVQLKNLRIGQPVEINVDMYGSDAPFHGRVVGLNPGTGAVFSVLPPQNATGNWIKIVQRVPVRISLDPEELKQHPLVLGLSVETDVDTHDRSGRQLPIITTEKPFYTTNVFAEELAGVDAIIEAIIDENCHYEQ